MLGVGTDMLTYRMQYDFIFDGDNHQGIVINRWNTMLYATIAMMKLIAVMSQVK